MEINGTLPNGAKVLAFVECGRYGTVLATRGGNDFVTWEYYDGKPGSTSNGHYFTELNHALDDFRLRLQNVTTLYNLKEIYHA